MNGKQNTNFLTLQSALRVEGSGKVNGMEQKKGK